MSRFPLALRILRRAAADLIGHARAGEAVFTRLGAHRLARLADEIELEARRLRAPRRRAARRIRKPRAARRDTP